MSSFRSALEAGLAATGSGGALSISAVLFSAAALTGCLFDGTSVAPADPGEITQTISYTVEGNSIKALPYTKSRTYCSGNVLETEYDTVEPKAVSFRIEGPTMTVFGNHDTLPSGAITEQFVVFTRQGSGTGLEGLWLNISQEIRVASGIPSREDSFNLEEDRKLSAAFRAYGRAWTRFAGGKIISYQDRDFAKQFISNWNDEFGLTLYADSARYAITVKTLDKHTVELKGRETGKTVRITLSFEGRIYSSDTPDQATHSYLYEPKACPNEYTPEWYEEFRQANAKTMFPEAGLGLEKSAEIRSQWGFSRHFPFSPLKTIFSLLN